MERHANILLIDDDLSVRQALGEALTVENYQVALAASGSEAARHLQQRGDRKFDVVMLDLRLGFENGWNVLASLTSLYPNLPVIVITANRGQSAPVGAHQCVAVMEKPLDMPLLFETLRNVTAAGSAPVR